MRQIIYLQRDGLVVNFDWQVCHCGCLLLFSYLSYHVHNLAIECLRRSVRTNQSSCLKSNVMWFQNCLTFNVYPFSSYKKIWLVFEWPPILSLFMSYWLCTMWFRHFKMAFHKGARLQLAERENNKWINVLFYLC